jgi:hypothetical protein
MIVCTLHEWCSMNPIDEDELRNLVRQSISRALGQPSSAGPAVETIDASRHTSHFRYALPESDGPCLIEPSVQCTHCGYCESHGH